MDKSKGSASGAAGCVVTAADSGRVVGSVACFGTFIAYGACSAILGPAVPALCKALDASKSKIGFIFTSRGIGFLAGTIGSASILNANMLPVSKEMMSCILLVIMGTATGLMAVTTNYGFIVLLSVFQGIGFGTIDTMGNCVLPEMWGSRVQPWMQALHLFFGVGAMISPALVGSIGFRPTFYLIFVASLIPLLFLVVCQQVFLREDVSPDELGSEALATGSLGEGTKSMDITYNKIASMDRSIGDSASVPTSCALEDGVGVELVSSNSSPCGEIITRSEQQDTVVMTGQEYSSLVDRTSRQLLLSRSRAAVTKAGTSEYTEAAVAAATKKTAANHEDQYVGVVDKQSARKERVPAGVAAEAATSRTTSTEVAAGVATPVLVPLVLRVLISLFYFIYAGAESGFAAWVSVYGIDVHVAASASEGAYLASVFWAALTVGRAAAVPAAVFVSASLMLRVQLALSMMATVLFLAVFSFDYAVAMFVSFLMGLALSSIYPLMMTIVSDYGFTMDAVSTTSFMLGATFGEALVPMGIGLIMEASGNPVSLPIIVLGSIAGVVTLYFVVHIIGTGGTVSSGTVGSKEGLRRLAERLRLKKMQSLSSKEMDAVARQEEHKALVPNNNYDDGDDDDDDDGGGGGGAGGGGVGGGDNINAASAADEIDL